MYYLIFNFILLFSTVRGSEKLKNFSDINHFKGVAEVPAEWSYQRAYFTDNLFRTHLFGVCIMKDLIQFWEEKQKYFTSCNKPTNS